MAIIMNQLLAKRLYDMIIKACRTPYLETNIEVYNISPLAVKGLKFELEGISFTASYQGLIRHEAFIWEDVIDIIIDPHETEDQDY